MYVILQVQQSPGQPEESSAPKRRRVQPKAAAPRPTRRKAAPQPAAAQQAAGRGLAPAAEAGQRQLSRMERMAAESGIDAAEMEEYY